MKKIMAILAIAFLTACAHKEKVKVYSPYDEGNFRLQNNGLVLTYEDNSRSKVFYRGDKEFTEWLNHQINSYNKKIMFILNKEKVNVTMEDQRNLAEYRKRLSELKHPQ